MPDQLYDLRIRNVFMWIVCPGVYIVYFLNTTYPANIYYYLAFSFSFILPSRFFYVIYYLWNVGSFYKSVRFILRQFYHYLFYRYIRLQRQKAVLQTRLKVPPPVNQFSSTLDKQTGSISTIPVSSSWAMKSLNLLVHEEWWRVGLPVSSSWAMKS